VADLQALADLLVKHNKRLAYENWCWSTHAPDWADVWDICRLVDRPNFGLCLDTFQTAGGEWADPSTETGLLKGKTKEECNAVLKESLEKLAKTIPAEKIYLLQISDAYKLDKPITKEDEDGMRPRGQWSHDYRPVPFQGGYLPVVDVARAVLKTGFRSWFSYEVFDSGKDGKGKEYKLEDFAKEAFACQEKLLAECAKE
jgi:sugar phosphate isomerase/epimerase